MGTGRTFYPCRCGGEIMEEWDHSSDYFECDNCSDPRNLPNIFIVGEAGSGKDFMVNVLKEIYSDYKNLKIAQPLYDLVDCLKADDKGKFFSILENIGFTQEQRELIWGNVPKHIVEEIKNPSTIKARVALQVLGDLVKNYNEYALIDYVANIGGTTLTIIEDARLLSEVMWLENKGFIGIKLYADEDVRVERIKLRDGFVDRKRLNHITETEVKKIVCEYEIDTTNATKEELVDKIKSIMYQ